MPLVKNLDDGADLFTAEGAIGSYLIVKPGTDKNTNATQVAPATAVSDVLLGAVQNGDALVDAQYGARLPNIGDNALVQLGGAVNLGDPLTTDANSKAVAAAPVAGTNNNIIGYAGEHGVANDIIVYKHNPGRIQG